MVDLNELLFYDVEVFACQSCVVFKRIDGETERIFTDNLAGLGEYVDKGLITHEGYEGLREYIKDKPLAGYNNHHYDDYILYAMSMGFGADLIKQWNDSKILKGSDVNMKRVDNVTLDVFQQIDISSPGLKKIEGNLGKSIVESTVDFDIDRRLTPQENLDTIKYCEYDVEQTIEIFKMREGYFKTKFKVIEMIDDDYLERKAVKWNTTSIVGQILAPKKNSVDAYGRHVSDEMLQLAPFDVQNMWRQLDGVEGEVNPKKFKTKKVIIPELGNDIEFGFGGLHGAPKGVFMGKNVKLLDVTSMYPSIIINFNGLGDKTELYEKIKQRRVELKKSGEDPGLTDAYKLILNSTYGLLNNQYSKLHNPILAYSVCIYGQISLYVLSQMLHNAGCRVFNINTDGVAFEPDIKGDYKKIIPEWEKQFGLSLEEDSFKSWVQKDVNNYMAVTDNGKILTKGGDVNNYTDYEDGGRNYYFNNSNTRIVQKALVNKVVYDTPIEDTILKNRDNVILYQYVLQAGRTYQGTFDTNGQKLQNVNRVFAGKNTGYEIYKKRQDGGLVKFADAPSDMILHNGDVKDFDSSLLDLQWYYDLTSKVYKRWEM